MAGCGGLRAAVGLAIYAVAAVSGAHINPAMTIAFAAGRSFPLRKVPHYLLAQLLGAILAATALYIVFGGPLAAFEQANGIVRTTRQRAIRHGLW